MGTLQRDIDNSGRNRIATLTLLVFAALFIFSPIASAQQPATTPAAESTVEAVLPGTDAAAETHAVMDFPPLIWFIAPIGSIIALVFAWIFYKQVRAADPGDEKMQEIAGHVRKGAYAYLKRQYMVVAVFFIIVCGILYWMGQIGVQHKIVYVAFLTGGVLSALCGFLGMKTATMAASRTTQGAKESLNQGLTVAFRAGAVMGLVVVGFGLLNTTVWFLILTQIAPRVSPLPHNIKQIHPRKQKRRKTDRHRKQNQYHSHMRKQHRASHQ